MALRDYIPGWRTKATEPAPVSSQATPYYFLAQTGREILPHEAWRLYKTVSTFATVVDLIADQVARMETVIEINGQPVEDGPIDDLLARPGYNRSKRQVIKELCIQQLVTGTAYCNMIGRMNQLPFMLDVYLSHQVSHVEGSDGWADAITLAEPRRNIVFEREDVGNDLRYFADDYQELLVMYDVAGDMKGRGLSRLQAVRADVDLKLSSIQHNVNVMNRGATLSGVLNFKEMLTPETAEAIRADVQGRMAGAHNAGGVLVTGGSEVDFKPIQQSNKDMDWANLVKAVNESIIARYNVPTTLFAVEAQTHHNFATAWEQFYTQAVLPQFDIIYGGLSRAFSERLQADVCIKHDALSVDILASKAAERAQNLVQAQLISPNEGRQMIGYEPFLGGDQVMGPPGMMPLYEDYMTDLTDVQITSPKPRQIGNDTPAKAALRAFFGEEVG